MKPLILAVLATGAGVTAFASPLSPTAAIRANPALFHAPLPLALGAVDVDPAAGLPSRFRQESAPLDGIEQRLTVEPIIVLRSPAPPPIPESDPERTARPFELVSSAQLRAVELAMGGPAQPTVPEPVTPAPTPTGMMPAAELKAMMAHVAATRRDDDYRPLPSTEPPTTLAAPSADEAPAIANAAQTVRGIEFEVAALVNGAPAGRVPLRIADGESISVRLGDILKVLRPMMDASAYDGLSTSGSAEAFVTLGDLRQHGIAVSFDGKDRLVFGRS